MYTVLWGAIAGVIMIGGVAERWGDVELMALGVAFAVGTVAPPLLWPEPSERARPLLDRTAFKMSASVVGFAVLMNYFCTPYFFDVLHMHFGFDTRIHIQNNPVFLYFMTVAYFATYLVLVCAGHRLARQLLPKAMRHAGYLVAPFAVAALETLLNANPFMSRLFCFDDMRLMLWFGTLSYGMCFVCTLPVWIAIDETPERRTPLLFVCIGMLGAMMAIVIVFEILRHHVAPHVTTVKTGSVGLRDFERSCLDRGR